MVQDMQKSYCYKIEFIIFFWLFTTTCVFSQVVAEPDCPDAYPICDASQSIYFEVNGPGVIDDAYGALGIFCQGQSSAQWEYRSAWFTFTPKYSGELGFYILPEIEEDWEFVLFGNNPDCSDLNNNTYWESCDTSSVVGGTSGYTGVGVHPLLGGPAGSVTGFQPYINVNAGEKYILYIAPYSFLVTGTRATLTFQGNLIDTHGSDAFEQTPCVLSVEEFNLNNTVSIYPNPVQDQLIISTATNFNKLELYTITGKKVFQSAFTETINTSQLAKGVYFLKLYTKNNGIAVKKLVKR